MSTATNEKRVIPKSAQFNSGDRFFNRAVTIAAFTSLAVLAGIVIFLGLQMIPVVQEQGLFFIFGSDWQMSSDVAGGEGARAGIWPMVWGSILISLIGLIIAVPTSLLLAIFIVFLAPARVAAFLTSVVDLMAAIPSVILGLWALYIFQPVAADWSVLLQKYLGFVPLFQTESQNFFGTPFVAGWVLGIMMIPIITAVTREVMGRTPPELINAAESLGCSLWTMLRDVALPFGKGGLTGGIMLGLGRALGETVAVFFVLKLVFQTNWYRILESEGGSVASLIVSKFGESTNEELTYLLAAGFVLFMMTLLVNMIATYIVEKNTKSYATL
jgi:phosphate transport system permease protein